MAKNEEDRQKLDIILDKILRLKDASENFSNLFVSKENAENIPLAIKVLVDANKILKSFMSTPEIVAVNCMVISAILETGLDVISKEVMKEQV